MAWRRCEKNRKGQTGELERMGTLPRKDCIWLAGLVAPGDTLLLLQKTDLLVVNIKAAEVHTFRDVMSLCMMHVTYCSI